MIYVEKPTCGFWYYCENTGDLAKSLNKPIGKGNTQISAVSVRGRGVCYGDIMARYKPVNIEVNRVETTAIESFEDLRPGDTVVWGLNMYIVLDSHMEFALGEKLHQVIFDNGFVNIDFNSSFQICNAYFKITGS